MSYCVFDCVRSCAALVDKRCSRCNFYKTKSQLSYGREMSIKRINKLPQKEKTYIIEKYYAGKVPS